MKISNLLLSISFVLLCCSNVLAQVDEIDQVVVTIDGDPVVKSEVIAFAQARQLDVSGELSAEKIREFAQQYVADDLLKRESTALGVRVFDEEVQAYVDEIKKQNGIDDAQFNQLLLERGLSRQRYEEQARLDILKSRIVSRQIRSTITISDQQVERYLEENPDQRPAAGSVRLLQIFVPIDLGRAVADELLQKIKTGESIAAVGGRLFTDVGYVDPENLREELKSAAEQLEVGKNSEVIESEVGYYIVQVASKVDADGKVDGEITEDIRNKLFEKEFKEKLDSYLTIELPKKYLVEFKI